MLRDTSEGGSESDSDDVIVDLSALNGLRGLVAVHIMTHHALLFSDLRINIQGSVSMPIFFLLSGFTLAVVYRKAHFGWRPVSDRCPACKLTCCCFDEIVRLH
jgi:hypothetical protein